MHALLLTLGTADLVSGPGSGHARGAHSESKEKGATAGILLGGLGGSGLFEGQPRLIQARLGVGVPGKVFAKRGTHFG